jgi:thymidine kinase
MAGEIQLIVGPMFSGKSTELLRRVKRYHFSRRSCFLIKYAVRGRCRRCARRAASARASESPRTWCAQKDQRYSSDAIATHDRQTLRAVPAVRLADVGAEWEDFDVVAIDEGQFFPDLLDFCETAANAGKVVIVAALDGTFQRRVRVNGRGPGSNAPQRTRRAHACAPARARTPHDRVARTCLQPFGGVCDLVARAERVDKLVAVCAVCGADAPFSKRISDETAVEVIGNEDKYLPVCRACFHLDALTCLARYRESPVHHTPGRGRADADADAGKGKRSPADLVAAGAADSPRALSARAAASPADDPARAAAGAGAGAGAAPSAAASPVARVLHPAAAVPALLAAEA